MPNKVDMEKVLLDTDIGSDIDDAICLAYLLADSNCDLLGITTVTGESFKRAQLASVLCKAAHKDIPIFPGAEVPLLVPQLQPNAPQAAALSKWEHATQFPEKHAVGFLRDIIRANPGEVTLLTIGPLTNIGLLFRIDPELPSLLKRLVMMCGVFEGGERKEWNAMLDPHATAIVYRSEAKVHRSIGLDVTMKLQMPAAEVRERFQHGLLRPVLDFAEVWFSGQEMVTFHDPLAALTIFHPEVCRFELGQVDVELNNEPLAGMTHWTRQMHGPHEVALEVNKGFFFEKYFKTLYTFDL